MDCDKIGEIKWCLIDDIHEAITGKDTSVSLDEAGQLTDMLKDVCAAERYEAESKYYKSQVEKIMTPHTM